MSKKIIFISSLVGFLGVTAFLLHFNQSIVLSALSLSKTEESADSGLVTCSLRANIGTSLLRMELKFQASDRKQEAALKKVIPIVQSEFMMNADTAGLKKIIQERNFMAIKAFLLKTINQHSAVPVKAVYFNSFNLIAFPT